MRAPVGEGGTRSGGEEAQGSRKDVGKPIMAAVINLFSSRSRGTEDQTGASGERLRTDVRSLVLMGATAGQWRMAWSNVSFASKHLGQSADSSLSSHER